MKNELENSSKDNKEEKEKVDSGLKTDYVIFEKQDNKKVEPVILLETCRVDKHKYLEDIENAYLYAME